MSPTRRRRPVAVVTDSTAGLPDELIAERGVTVVPLTVSIDGASGREGVDAAPREYRRRGGRIGGASAVLGPALSVKPILRMVDGEIVVRDKVRTASRALARLVDLAVEAAGDAEVAVGVHHLAAPARADELVVRLRERLGDRLRACYETEIGAAVGAHVGPGLASVAVHIRSTA